MITCSIASECHGALANANKDFISNWYPFPKLQAYFIHVLRETSIASNANISSLLEFTRWSFSLYMCNWFSNNNKCSKKQGYVDALCFHRFYFAQPSCLDISQRDPEVSLQKFNQFQMSLGVTEIQFWGAPRYRDICIYIYNICVNIFTLKDI